MRAASPLVMYALTINATLGETLNATASDTTSEFAAMVTPAEPEKESGTGVDAKA